MTSGRWFTQAFGAAVEDIRARLIDEAWHGRRAGASADHHHTHEHHHDREHHGRDGPEIGMDR